MTTQQANEKPATEVPKSNSLKVVARTAAGPHLVSVNDRPRAIDSEARQRADSRLCSDPVAVAAVVSLQGPEQVAASAYRSYIETPSKRLSTSSSLKRLLDLVGTLVLALVFSPLIVAIVAMMTREEGPVLFKHRRVGRDGRVFECLKFRTMVPNADQVLRHLFEEQPDLKAEWIRNHKLRNDPRITGIGRFLRRTSLDELPQLWNVLRGDMSLVGPRPVVREELMRYGRNSQSYLSVKPGITGLWQVTGRNDIDYRRRVAIDVYYVRKRNLLLDLYILLKTTRVVLAGDGAY